MKFSQNILNSRKNNHIDNEHSILDFQDGVCVIKHTKMCQSMFDVKMALENKMGVLKICGTIHSPLLIDFSVYENSFPLYSPVAKSILLENSSMYKRAGIAFLFNNEHQIRNAYSFQSLNKHNIPLKFFTNKEEAILWLQSLILN